MQKVNIHTHLNAPQLRIDTWNELAALANTIHYIAADFEKCKSYENDVKYLVSILKSIELFHAFPGVDLCNKVEMLFYQNEFIRFYELVSLIIQALHLHACDYRGMLKLLKSNEIDKNEFVKLSKISDRYYFEVLVVEDMSDTRKEILRQELESYFQLEDKFVYELVFVNSFEDAVIAVMFNYNIKCCWISDFLKSDVCTNIPVFKNIIIQANVLTDAQKTEPSIPIASQNFPGSFSSIEQNPLYGSAHSFENTRHAASLANTIRSLRQREIEIYYLCSYKPEKNVASIASSFDKIFYSFENYFEFHLTILQAIKNHFEAPFFDSLKQFTFEPKSSFHALPVARGKSIFQSKWIHDMQDFYGKNIFIAESSSTAGGLDSLMNPVGSIMRAMKKASDYFGSNETFFVTNGTSSSNKIVLQAVLKPGDIVLIEHTCHESHHYGLILNGVYPIFLNGYHVDCCDIVGPISLRTIKEKLLLLKKENKLHKVKLIVLTNCTFDGLVYNVRQYMEEILAIKPDIIFLWDEAWFAYARCVPHYRLRTAMFAAHFLENKYKDPQYRKEYNEFKKRLAQNEADDEFLLTNKLLPDPDLVKIRVYCTQSTHKSLSCLRQGSMIHVYDCQFASMKDSFTHAFVTYSTTSPNYQILATMDLARRQADLEGFELVQNAIALSMIFRQEINKHPLISRYFQALGPSELIPEEFRLSKVVSGYEPEKDWATVEKAWVNDDIVIDPTRVTLMIKSRFQGPSLRRVLMDRFGIQVNKTSLNSILIQFNIGTLRSSVSYLLESLFVLTTELYNEDTLKSVTVQEVKCYLPPAPDFSEFSADFLPYSNIPAGDLRKAFYLGQDNDCIEYMKVNDIIHHIQSGEQIVAASIVIPVPPGYPILLPGQVITEEILNYMQCLDPASIIGGYSLTSGLSVFRNR